MARITPENPGKPTSSIRETTAAHQPVANTVIAPRASYPPRGASVVEHDGGNHTTRDSAAGVEFYLQKIADLIWLVLGVAIAFIGLRVVLRLIAADTANGFARFIYDVTGPLVAPFANLAPSPAMGQLVLETSSLVAMLVYALAAWIFVRLVWLIFEQPPTAYYRDSFDRSERKN